MIGAWGDEPTKEADAAKEIFDREVASAWSSVLTTKAGRLFVWSILDQCGVFNSTYARGADSAFLEGKRDVGLSLISHHITPHGPTVFSDILRDAALRLDEIDRAIARDQEDSHDG